MPRRIPRLFRLKETIMLSIYLFPRQGRTVFLPTIVTLLFVILSFASSWTTHQLLVVHHRRTTNSKYTKQQNTSLHQALHNNDDFLCSRKVLLTNNLEVNRRREFLKQCCTTSTIITSTGIGFTSRPCNAGEIGRRITEAITTSELGVSVRRSIVRGAQIMDQIDLQTERFSDTYQLGSERTKQSKRPKPKVIPPLQPLDTVIATEIIDTIDSIFCDLMNIPKSILQKQIQIVNDKVLPSFIRSGLPVTSNNNNNNAPNTTTATKSFLSIENSAQFNFAMYVHYKSYADLLLEYQRNTKDFPTFQKRFETRIGQEILSILMSSSKSNDAQSTTTTSTTALSIPDNVPNDQVKAFFEALQRIDQISAILVNKGFVAQIDRTEFATSTNGGANNNNDNSILDIYDWSQRISDLSISVALDYDITLASQILLQEQGIRLYPNYIRCMIQTILQQSLVPYQQRIVAEDYYLDTDYNSDPDKFDVKEVLININLENI